MKKKLFLLVMVLGIVPSANALMVRLSLDGVNPAPDAVDVFPGQVLPMYIISDSDGEGYLQLLNTRKDNALTLSNFQSYPAAGDLASITYVDGLSHGAWDRFELEANDSAGNIEAGKHFSFDVTVDAAATPGTQDYIYLATPATDDSLLFNVVPQPATTYYVDALNGDDDNDGLSLETAFTTIQKGIDSADDGDVVLVAPGTYTGHGNRDIDFLGKAITVRSESGPENCIIDCQGTEDDQHRGFYFHGGENANSVLAGFKIINGYASPEKVERYRPKLWAIGGAIYCARGNPTIKNCILIDNFAPEWGGGMYFENSSATIYNCRMTSNSAKEGGAVYTLDSEPTFICCDFNKNRATGQAGGAILFMHGAPTIIDSNITNNSTEVSGGGIYCQHSNATITNCIFTGNSGGGIRVWGAIPIISNCTFRNNSGLYGAGITARCSGIIVQNCLIENNSADHYAYGGGAICLYQSPGLYGLPNPVISNCIMRGNSTAHCGGAIYCYREMNPLITNCLISGNYTNRLGGAIYCSRDCSPILDNCTIVDNMAAMSGGAVYCYNDASPEINNSILSGNISPDRFQIVLVSEKYPSSLTISHSNIEGGQSAAYADNDCSLVWERNNIDADPWFVDPDSNDFHLLTGSPCIDAGDNTAVPTDTTDLDGDGNTTEPIPFDLDGNPRIVDGNDDGIAVVDMGAYEAMASCFGVNHVKLETKAGKKGNKVELKGTFEPAVPIDFAVDDVAYIIDDGQGNALAFLIPAGSFEVDGKPGKQKFKFHSAKGSQPDIKAKFDFDKCKFELKAKKVPNTDEITGTTLTIELWAGANLAQELVQVEVKPKHLEFKREPKLSCCPKCKGIALLEVTSDQGVFVFEPEPGKEKLKRKTVVDDGVNGRVKIDTSCSKPLEVGDVFGAYTVTDLIKIFDDLPDGDNDE